MPQIIQEKSKALEVGPPLVFACQVFVVLPLVIYLGNLSEIAITLPSFLGVSLLVAVVAIAVLVTIQRLLPDGLQNTFSAVLSVLTILFWAQSTLLVRDYGLLDGGSIDWDSFGHAGLIDSLIWVTGLVSGFILIRFGKHRRVFHAAAFLVAIQFASTIVEASQKYGDIQFRQKETYDADPASFYAFSKTQNIIHILVDGFQSDIFADLASSPETAPRYSRIFDGFIYFEETLGVFPYTQFSLPALLTGKVYLNKETKNEFLDRTMAGPSILRTASEHGFAIDIAAAGTYLYSQYANVPHDSIFLIDSLGKASPTITGFLEIADLAAFRLLPHTIKPFVYNDQKWAFQSMAVTDEAFKYQFFQNTYFLEELIRNLSATRTGPVYKYVHVSNTHRPMVADSECQYAGRTFGDSRRTLTIQSKCTLDTLGELFDKLRAEEIYDSSLIIVHADHGGWVPNRRQGKPIRLATGHLAPPPVTSLASPLLAVKPPESVGPLVTSDALVSLLDIPDTISSIMQFDASFRHESVFRQDDAKSRIRRFYFYWWQQNEYEAEYADAIQEFMIQGSHYENNWILRSVHRPPR